ncbi:MAG: transglutaminase-like cysteine peptidase [Sphingomonas sp.]
MEGDGAQGRALEPASVVRPPLGDPEQGATGSVTVDAAEVVEAPAVCDREVAVSGGGGFNDIFDAQPLAFEPLSFLPFFSGNSDMAAISCAPVAEIADSTKIPPANIAGARPTLTEVAARNSAKGHYAALDLALIKHLNTEVNRNVIQVTDQNLYGTGEYWARPSHNGRMVGDCEDIAIEKRMRLIEMGIDPSDLTLAVVFSKQWGLHTILVAHLSDGDFVLDSLSYQLRRWDQTDYRWLRIQSRQDPREWLTIQS